MVKRVGLHGLPSLHRLPSRCSDPSWLVTHYDMVCEALAEQPGSLVKSTTTDFLFGPLPHQILSHKSLEI